MRIIIIRIEGVMIKNIQDPEHCGSLASEKYEQIQDGTALRQVSSADLLGNSDALTISHQGACYVLRQTRAGKLILTK
jgi:hemin uptake protein HemP